MIAPRLRTIIAACALLVMSMPALVRAQDLHGWFIVQSTSREGATKTSIVHLTPPGGMAPRGSVRNVLGLWRAPDRMAWSGSTVYMLMPAERVGKDRVERRVYSLAAVAGLVAGWEYVPSDRPETLPTLGKEYGARDVDVEGFGASAWSPVVLLRKQGTPERTLLVLDGSSWVRTALPWERPGVPAPDADAVCHLVSSGRSVGILAEPVKGGAARWYLASGKLGGPGTASAGWTSQDVLTAPPAGVVRATDTVCSVENQLLRVTVDAPRLTLSVIKTGGELVVTELKDVGPDPRIAGVEGAAGYIAVLSGHGPAQSEPPSSEPVTSASASGAEAAFRVIEVTPTGRVLYDGPAKQGGPVSLREVQVLMVLLVAVMAAVVIFVLRPEKKRPPTVALPKGLMPAESSRRIMATILDLGASWVVASMVVRLDLADAARPEVVFATSKGWIAIATTFGLTWLSGVILEWQFGVTLGKLLLGSRVMALPPEPPKDKGGAEPPQPPPVQGVSLAAAIVRNVAKWTPWNIVEFLATGRARPWADRVSKTVVVVSDMSDQEQGG